MDLLPYIPYLILGATFCLAWILILYTLGQTAATQDDDTYDDDSDVENWRFLDAIREDLFKY